MSKQRILVEQRVFIEEESSNGSGKAVWFVVKGVFILLGMAVGGAMILALGSIALLVGAVVGLGWLLWKLYTVIDAAQQRKEEERQKAQQLAVLAKRAELLRLSNESRKLDYLEWLRSGAQQPAKLLEVVQPSQTRRIDSQSKAKNQPSYTR